MKDKLQQMAGVFKALGDNKRLKIIKMLASNMNDTLCVSDVAQKLGITQPAASQHIKVLKNIDILNENRKGFRVFYTINTDVLLQHKKDMDELFLKGFEKCEYDFACSECPYGSSCIG
ncbi:MAG: winged helix-turn-helix transcriptional regulator [bacterium]|nr:winged helix-turn-helix transcriptional regulator [bacterium]